MNLLNKIIFLTIKYFQRRKVWLYAHKKHFKIIIPTLSVIDIVDMRDESNQKKMKFLRVQDTGNFNQILKELENQKRDSHGV